MFAEKDFLRGFISVRIRFHLPRLFFFFQSLFSFFFFLFFSILLFFIYSVNSFFFFFFYSPPSQFFEHQASNTTTMQTVKDTTLTAQSISSVNSLLSGTNTKKTNIQDSRNAIIRAQTFLTVFLFIVHIPFLIMATVYQLQSQSQYLF
jgi:hypothetical protein